METEVFKIDEKYSIQIRNNGTYVDLLRCGESWQVANPGKVWIAVAYKIERFDELLKIAKELRTAQKNYMDDRGNDGLGKIVGEKAAQLDEAIECIEER